MEPAPLTETAASLTPTFSKYDASGVAKGYLSSEDFLREMLAEASGVDVEVAVQQIVGDVHGESGQADTLGAAATSGQSTNVLWKRAFTCRWGDFCPVSTATELARVARDTRCLMGSPMPLADHEAAVAAAAGLVENPRSPTEAQLEATLFPNKESSATTDAELNPYGLQLLTLGGLEVSSYDGGQESDSVGVANVLVPNLTSIHCSGPGVCHTLVLAPTGSPPRTVITHVVLYGAPRCTEPLKSGKVQVVQQTGETVAEADFETLQGTHEAVVPLHCRIIGPYELRVTFGSSWAAGHNVDVGLVAVVGKICSNEDPAWNDVSAGESQITLPKGGLKPGGEPTPAIEKVHTAFMTGKRSVTGFLKKVARKSWLPLESNPQILGNYLNKIGFSLGYSFHDVVSFEDFAVDMVPTPVHAVLMLFPITEIINDARKAEAPTLAVAAQPAGDGKLIHIKQYIPNACGTIGLLHAASNLAATGEVPAPAAESWLAKFLEKVRTLDAAAAGQLLENDVEIEEAHAMAESESVDAAARHEDVYRHFISFIERDGSIWELDGMKVAPVNLGPTSKVTFLKDTLQAIKERFVELAPDNAQDFVIFALAPAGANATGMALGIEAGSSHTSPQSVDIDEADVTELMMIGNFSEDRVRHALQVFGGNKDQAMNMLFS